MIAQLSGRVASRDADGLVIDVGGVGLELQATRAAERLAVPGQAVTLQTHLHVREDALQLYGFASTGERRLFRLLLGVTGIGPKLALAICSAYAPEQLERAIAGQDVALLASVSGVGRKTAQRICVDLRDRVGGGERAGSATAVPAGADLADPFYAAREALLALGFAVGDAEAALAGADGGTEARVRTALGRLAPVGAER